MSAISLPSQPEGPPQVRPLNALHDLPRVADLIELCFQGTLDRNGRAYIDQMRRVAQGASLPLTGYVWEQDGRIVGNISLIPFRGRSGRIYLIANVAVHPDQRGRGIARQLTVQAVAHARQRRAESIWLQVRDDNQAALHLYGSQGFVERLRRTTWQAAADPALPPPLDGISLGSPTGREWTLQRLWLQATYPPETDWHRPFRWELFQTGAWKGFKRFLLDQDVRQWAAFRDGKLQAVLSAMVGRNGSNWLWPAIPPQADPSVLTVLLRHARARLPGSLSVDYPAGRLVEAIQAAGFSLQRTLVWMRLDGATVAA